MTVPANIREAVALAVVKLKVSESAFFSAGARLLLNLPAAQQREALRGVGNRGRRELYARVVGRIESVHQRWRISVSTSSSDGQRPASRKDISPNVPASGARPFPASNVLSETSESTSSSGLQVPSEQPSTISLLQQAQLICLTMMRSSDAPNRPKPTSLTPTPSSMPSTRRQDVKSNASAGPGDRPWDVKFHREVAQTIANNGGEDWEVGSP
jgi:hypothetical protein